MTAPMTPCQLGDLALRNIARHAWYTFVPKRATTPVSTIRSTNSDSGLREFGPTSAAEPGTALTAPPDDADSRESQSVGVDPKSKPEPHQTGAALARPRPQQTFSLTRATHPPRAAAAASPTDCLT